MKSHLLIWRSNFSCWFPRSQSSLILRVNCSTREAIFCSIFFFGTVWLANFKLQYVIWLEILIRHVNSTRNRRLVARKSPVIPRMNLLKRFYLWFFKQLLWPVGSRVFSCFCLNFLKENLARSYQKCSSISKILSFFGMICVEMKI